MSEYIEFAVRVPKDKADSFIARFGKGNVKILGYLLGEEVVRCKDCVNVDGEDYGAWGRAWHCEKFGEVEPDGFCAWGERRVDV